MAENNEDRNPDDLSEEASPYRLEEYRKKGQVAQSKEIAALALFLASGIVLFSMAPSIAESIVHFMKDSFTTDLATKPGNQIEAIASNRLLEMLRVVAKVGLPISLVGFVLGIAAHISQIGFLVSLEALTADLEKINPLSGLQRLLSPKNLVETARVVLKGVILVFVAYMVLKSEILNSPSLIFRNPVAIFEVLGSAGKRLFLTMCGILSVFAAIDLFNQKREYGKQVRVTRQEAKQEAKEQDGDPLVKARIRSVQRDMARKRMMNAVKKADVIITNPTHIAVALQYDRDKMVAPKVVAKGADLIAQRIKAIAAENGVVIVENVPLARAMFKSVKIGQVIPRNLFQAVAEVLAYVYKLKNQKW